MRLLLPAAFAALVLAGCAGGRVAREERAYAARLEAERDALRAELAAEQTRVAAYADSIRFYDSIDSGEYDRLLRTLRDRIESLEFRLAGGGGGAGTPLFTTPADSLFEPASATLSAPGMARLDGLAAALRQHPEATRFRVEGHADASPVGPSLREKFPSNWELAAQRAAAAVRYLVAAGLDAARFEVASRGDVEPIAPNTTAEGRARNRRIVVYAQ